MNYKVSIKTVSMHRVSTPSLKRQIKNILKLVMKPENQIQIDVK